MFESLTDDEIEILPFTGFANLNFSTVEPTEPTEQPSLIDTCEYCKGPNKIIKSIITCQNCGYEIKGVFSNESSSTSYNNVYDQGFMSMKVIGINSYGNQKSLLKSSADYTKFRAAATLKEIELYNQSCKRKIPKNVIKTTIEIFEKIKSFKCVFRNSNKLGVIACCVYYACYLNGISRTTTECASIFNTNDKYFAFGARILHDLAERGIIELPQNVDPINDFIYRYFEQLELNPVYIQFIKDIIARAEIKKVHIINDVKPTVKVVGAIYLLCDRLKLYNKDKIEELCEIKKIHFLKYYNILCNHHKLLKKVFKKHKIPMKRTWRN